MTMTTFFQNFPKMCIFTPSGSQARQAEKNGAYGSVFSRVVPADGLPEEQAAQGLSVEGDEGI